MLPHAKEHLFNAGTVPPVSFTLWLLPLRLHLEPSIQGHVWKHHFTTLSPSSNPAHRFVKEDNNSREKGGGGRDQICEMLNFSSLSLVLCFMTPNGLSLVSRPAEVKGQDRGWPEVKTDITDPTSGQFLCWSPDRRRHMTHADVFTLLGHNCVQSDVE